MKVHSVNVGQPITIGWEGEQLRTSIMKRAVDGAVRVDELGLQGDTQSDLTVHGGPDKAVYLYPQEHYAVWSDFLGQSLPPGALGENLTTRGLLESDLSIGDRLAVGTTVLEVSEPRLPCTKLAARYGRPDLVARFVQEALPGVYLRVLEPGEVQAGDAASIRERHPERWTVREVFQLLTNWRGSDRGDIVRLAGMRELGVGARGTLQRKTGLEVELRAVSASKDGDFPQVARGLGSLLEAEGLPTLGFPEDTPTLFVAVDQEGELMGGAAMEAWDGAFLLRSVVVSPEHRNHGIGRGIVRGALRHAGGSGADSVSLLTETSDEFFRSLDFVQVPRDELPGALASSMELREACGEAARSFTRTPP